MVASGLEWPFTLDIPGLMAGGWRPIPFREFVVKVHSRCDLACDYCYMYEIADETWRARPGRMSVASAEAMVGVGQKRMDAVATEMASVRYMAEQVR